jgi:hypothetical protein
VCSVCLGSSGGSGVWGVSGFEGDYVLDFRGGGVLGVSWVLGTLGFGGLGISGFMVFWIPGCKYGLGLHER